MADEVAEASNRGGPNSPRWREAVEGLSTPRRILRRNEVCEMTGLSYSTIYRMEKAGRFPRRVKLGQQAVGWRMADVVTWMDTRIEV